MDAQDLHDLTAAYALDALEDDERAAYEAHLARCPRCQEELAELGEAAGALAYGVAAPAPPERLRARILQEAAAERRNVVSLPVRRLAAYRMATAAAAVAACAAIGLGVWAGTLSHSLGRERSARAAEARAAALLADPAARRVALGGASGALSVDPRGRAVLVVRSLAPAPSGHTYEAWVVPAGGAPLPAGLFRGGGASTLVELARAVPRGAAVAVTVERAGGAAAPSQKPILSAQT